VEDSPSGASVLHVQVKGAPAAADRVVDAVLGRLKSEVSENFTAG
jgi:hypothetical protein